MEWSTRCLGQSTVAKLRARTKEVLLTIGKDRFTRHDLSTVDCWTFKGAANLSKLLAELFDVTSTADLFNRVPPLELASTPQLGSFSVAALGAAFAVKGLGGDDPIAAWFAKHRDKDAKREFVTFDTYKARASDTKAARAERKQARTRKHARRDQAHRLRVDRYNQRQQGSA